MSALLDIHRVLKAWQQWDLRPGNRDAVRHLQAALTILGQRMEMSPGRLQVEMIAQKRIGLTYEEALTEAIEMLM